MVETIAVYCVVVEVEDSVMGWAVQMGLYDLCISSHSYRNVQLKLSTGENISPVKGIYRGVLLKISGLGELLPKTLVQNPRHGYCKLLRDICVYPG